VNATIATRSPMVEQNAGIAQGRQQGVRPQTRDIDEAA